jgi:hypothetical protein
MTDSSGTGVESHTAQGVTDEMIAQRAYEISLRNEGATPQDDWFRAAQELRAESASGEEQQV